MMEKITSYQVRVLTSRSYNMLRHMSERIGEFYPMKTSVGLTCCLLYGVAVKFFS